jgi:hypothetical protein
VVDGLLERWDVAFHDLEHTMESILKYSWAIRIAEAGDVGPWDCGAFAR